MVLILLLLNYHTYLLTHNPCSDCSFIPSTLTLSPLPLYPLTPLFHPIPNPNSFLYRFLDGFDLVAFELSYIPPNPSPHSDYLSNPYLDPKPNPDNHNLFVYRFLDGFNSLSSELSYISSDP
jgi:hypothetical protein